MDTKQVIVITGASSGFGRGCALRFAAQGAELALAARREEVLNDLAEECEAAGGTAVVIPTDVSLQSDVEALLAETRERFGRVDVWINNAGAGAIGKFEDIPLADHVKVIETDLLGTIYGSYLAMKLFREQGGGILINVSSVVGQIPMPYYSSYAAAKHGVTGLSAAIRKELALEKNTGIRVCTVYPTSTDTPFFQHAANYSGHEFVPTPPVYDPNDVIDVIVGLAKEPEDEVAVGAAAKAAIFAHQMAPGITESHMAKATDDTLQKAPPAVSSDGSLNDPSTGGTSIRG